MNVHELILKSKRALRSNQPAILAGIGIAGVVVTGYFAARGGQEANKILADESPDLDLKEKALLTWKCYIPAATSGGLTIASIVGSTAVHGRRTAAAVSAYSVTERMFQEYREKVKEELGPHKEQVLRDDIARKRMEDNPPKAGQVLIAGGGEVLCCELHTDRYFTCDMETLKRAQNEINRRVISELYVTMTEFYDLIGLRPTKVSDELGWDSDRLLELEYSAVFAADGRPCLAFNYNYYKPI